MWPSVEFCLYMYWVFWDSALHGINNAHTDTHVHKHTKVYAEFLIALIPKFFFLIHILSAHWGMNEMADILEWHVQMHFHENICMSITILIWFCYYGTWVNLLCHHWWLMYWLSAVRQQAITSINDDKDPWLSMASFGHNELSDHLASLSCLKKQ